MLIIKYHNSKHATCINIAIYLLLLKAFISSLNSFRLLIEIWENEREESDLESSTTILRKINYYMETSITMK